MKRVLLLWLILVFGSSTAFAEDIKKDFHQTFDVRPGVVLHLRHGDGDVKIRPWDRDVVDVKVRYHARYTSVGIGGPRDFDVEFRQGKNDIYVIGEETGSNAIRIGFYSFRYIEYVYEINAPSYIELDLNGDDGDVEIQNWKADLTISLDDGDVDIEQIEASDIRVRMADGEIRLVDIKSNVRIKMEDGDVYMRNCESEDCLITGEDGEVQIRKGEGNLEIEMDDGDVDIMDFKGERLRVRTADGDVNADLLKSPHCDVRIVTEDGAATVGLERGFSARYVLQTDDGRMRVDIPDVEVTDNSRHRKSGEFNGGNGRIRIRTADGDIVLRMN